MILLDTDHVSVLGFPTSSKREALTAKMRDSPDDHFAIAIVTVEEQLRGCLAEINRYKEVHNQVPGYERLLTMMAFLSVPSTSRSLPSPWSTTHSCCRPNCATF